MKLIINCDGGARGNPGLAAAAFVVHSHSENIRDKSGKPFDFAQGKYLGMATNNEAEYQAVVEALGWLANEIKDKGFVIKDKKKEKGNEIEQVNFFLDSSLVVNQLNGVFKVKEPRLRDLLVSVRGLEGQIGLPITYSYIPREKNTEADLLVNQTLDQNS